MLKILRPRLQLWTILLLILVAGCSSGDDDRLAELGQQSADRQAEQNQTIADQSRQVTETTHEFVESSGDARKEMIELQRELVEAEAEARNELGRVQQDLVDRDAECRQELNALQQETQFAIQVERQSIDRQREDLKAERRDIADKRHRAPIIAAAVTQVGLILACLAPLALCGYLLYVLRHTGDDDEAVTELLVEELTSERPRLLLPGPPPATQPALSNPAGPAGTKETGSGQFGSKARC